MLASSLITLNLIHPEATPKGGRLEYGDTENRYREGQRSVATMDKISKNWRRKGSWQIIKYKIAALKHKFPYIHTPFVYV